MRAGLGERGAGAAAVNSRRSNPSDWCAGPLGPPRSPDLAATMRGQLPIMAAPVGNATPVPRLSGALRQGKRLRTQLAVIALSVLLVAVHGASTVVSLSRSYHRTLDDAAAALHYPSASRNRGQVLPAWYRECAISLLGFLLFARPSPRSPGSRSARSGGRNWRWRACAAPRSG